MVIKQDFLENWSVTMTKREIRKTERVDKGWLSTLCCWEAVVRTYH